MTTGVADLHPRLVTLSHNIRITCSSKPRETGRFRKRRKANLGAVEILPCRKIALHGECINPGGFSALPIHASSVSDDKQYGTKPRSRWQHHRETGRCHFWGLLLFVGQVLEIRLRSKSSDCESELHRIFTTWWAIEGTAQYQNKFCVGL